MEFLGLYGRDIGEFIAWLSKPETNIPAIKLIQVIGALLGAMISALGLYKAWRYAERRLGQRLDEFLNKEEQRLLTARSRLNELHSNRPSEHFDLSTLLSNKELKSVLKAFGKRFRLPAKTALQEAISRTEERGRLARKKEELHFKQKSVAHLLLGAIADAEKNHQAALIQFQSALELDPEDAEALEYVGFQYLRLGNAGEALTAFSKLESIAKDRRNFLLQAQASRYCGMAYEKLPTPRLRHANNSYAAAISVFPKDGPQTELAQIYECRGLVSIELGFHQQANECLMHALARYAEHERTQKRRPTSRPGTTRILAALKRLEEMNNSSSSVSYDGNGIMAFGSNGSSEPQLQSNQQQLTQQPPNGERPN